MRGRNIIQILKAVDLLSEPGGISIKELSRRLEVDRRSGYRLLEVWFSAGRAKYLKERKYSASQEIEDRPDGSIILRMRTSGWFDVKKWLLGFGASAQMLRPKELREEIRQELQSALNCYQVP